MRVAIAGGGTGGHLFPALAVGEALQARGHEVLIFISEKEVDALGTTDRDEFRFEKLPGVGMPRLFSPAVLLFLKRFNESLSPCRRIYRQFLPDAVLGMGGFTSTAPILAGRMRHARTFVHESNAIPGKANKLNARLSNVVLLGFEECAQYFPHRRCEVTGTPVRNSLHRMIPKPDALRALGLDEGKLTMLVMGGSQGAHGINEAVAKALPLLKDTQLQAVHLSGPQDEQVMTANYRRETFPAYVAPFCHRMEEVYAAADFVVARSGAASLTEIAFFGLPSILIPYPFAAEDHQTRNAEIFARAGAAELLKQDAITAETLAEKVRFLTRDRVCRERMSARARSLAQRDAAGRVAEVIEKHSK